MSSSLIYFLIAIIIVLLLVLLWVIAPPPPPAPTSSHDNNYFTTAEHKTSPTNSPRRNCDSEVIYAMTDAQCSNICRTTGMYRASNGRCVNVLALSTTNPQNNCDPERGVLAYMTGDPQLGTTHFRCLSIDLGIQGDSPDDPNILCKDGNIDINYLETMPQLNQCTCPDDKVLAIIPNNRMIRTHGQCVSKNLLPVLEFANALYNPDVV